MRGEYKLKSHVSSLVQGAHNPPLLLPKRPKRPKQAYLIIHLYIGSRNNKFLLRGFYSRSALFRLRNPDRLCRVTVHLHKVEPLSTLEAHDAHEAQEVHKAHNAPLTTLTAHQRQLTLKMNGSWPPRPLKTLLVWAPGNRWLCCGPARTLNARW